MHRLKLLADSRIGMIHKCECCAGYHVTMGNVSIRLTHGQMLALTKLVAKALKIDCFDNGLESKKQSRTN